MLYQVRDLAAVLTQQADALRATVIRLHHTALNLQWQSSSARACLDEIASLSSQLTQRSQSYDSAALCVLAHAQAAESVGASVLGFFGVGDGES